MYEFICKGKNALMQTEDIYVMLLCLQSQLILYTINSLGECYLLCTL